MALGVSEKTVTRHESGYTPVKRYHLLAYADFYGVPIEALEGREAA